MSDTTPGFSPIPDGSFIPLRTRARLLILALVFLRLPFLDHPKPVHPDESEFVDAIGFPQPYPVHPPGYPLWTAMGTVFAKFSRGEYEAYQVLAVIGSAIASLFLYLILRRWVCGDGVAWLASLAMGLNPLMWFHAVTALNYTMACAAALAVVYFQVRSVTDQRPRDLKIATSIFAVSLFLRPDLLLWIGPLWAALAVRHPLKTWLPAALVLAVAAIGTWQVAGYLYGQSDAGRAAMAHTREVVWNTSVFNLGLRDGFMRNGLKLIANLVWDFGILAVVLPLAWRTARKGGERGRNVTNVVLLAALPLVAFTLLIHMSEPGHVMLLLPAGYAVLAAGLACVSVRAGKIAAMAMAALAAAQFLLYPWSPTSEGYKRIADAKIGYISAAGLRQIDRRAEIHRPGDYWPTGASSAPAAGDEAPRMRGHPAVSPPPQSSPSWERDPE